jgi:SAM-dependent methyltransferase
MVERSPDYAFGDSELAARRLELLAAVFERSSEQLLAEAGAPDDEVAVDLGCGPGHTTALLARVSGATTTIGLDRSPAFVEEARRRWGRELTFEVHDVALTPFPTPPIDLLFARFVLAHLPNPVERIASWCTQLGPRGRFVTIETERIDTDVDTFVDYEETVRSVVAQHNADLQVGRVIRDLEPPPDTSVIHSELAEVRPPTSTFARLYAMNLATWRNDPFVVEAVPAERIDSIARGLECLQSSDEVAQLTFCNRQVIYRRD